MRRIYFCWIQEKEFFSTIYKKEALGEEQENIIFFQFFLSQGLSAFPLLNCLNN